MSYYYQDLEYDLQGIRSDLSSMNNQLSSGFASIEGGLDEMNMYTALMAAELGEMNESLKTLVEEFIGFRTESYLQNEIRNQHLEQIELSLKNPMQTQAMEQYDIAATLVNRGNHKLALKHLLKAVELYPLHFRTYIQLSTVYIMLKDYDQALDFAEQSVSHAPIDSIFDYRSLAHQLIGKVYFHKAQYEDAYQAIKRSMQFEATPEIQYDFARYAALSHHHSEVLPHLEKAILQRKEFFTSALLDCAIAFASMKEETASFLQQMKQKRKRFLTQFITEARQVHLFKTEDIERIFTSSAIQSTEKEQVTRRVLEVHETLKAFKAGELQKMAVLLDKAQYFMEKNTYLDILEGIDVYKTFQDYTQQLPSRLDTATMPLYSFSRESGTLKSVESANSRISSLKNAAAATDNMLKATPLFDFSERKALKAKKQKTFEQMNQTEQIKRAVETDLQLHAFFSAGLDKLKNACSTSVRPILELNISAFLMEDNTTEITKPPALSERIERIVTLIESEIASGNTVSWNKSERDEWIGSTNWVLVIDPSLNELRKHFIPLVGRNIQIGEALQFTRDEVVFSSYSNFRTQLPPEQLTEGRLLDETGKRDELVIRFIEWNAQKLAIEEKYARIATTRRIFAASPEGPVSFGENQQFIVPIIRY